MITIEPVARSKIEFRLSRVAQEDGIRYLMAVESGSRAWGFPSPDSDYDVRFIYVRPARDYVTLRPLRDVIERPIVDDFDVNGWDIRKTLGLLLKHNAVVAEWLDSPIRYLPDDPAIGELSALADRHFDPRGYALHYASLGMNNVKRWPEHAETLSAKRYFYALRPALAVRALRMNPLRRPPMRLQDLMAVIDLPPAIADQINELVTLKAQKREKAGTKRSVEIEALVHDELARAGTIEPRLASETFLNEADMLFRRIVGARD
nr:nucleotidyltransferase domain-containing protein [Novosphingobium hassiacum]